MKTKLLGLVASLLVASVPSLFGATITNPSFETDTFTTFPGYYFQAGNGTITGWTPSGGAGLNPAAGSPFADNGAIPNGSQVAFIQNGASASLSTTISGLTPGTAYKVSFRVNARSGNTPNLKVNIDATRIIDTAVTPVGGANPYKYFDFDFTASAASQTLTLLNDAGGDNTVVFDDFSIAVNTSGWSYASWTDDATSGVDGSKSYTHAYSFGSGTSTTINGISFTGIGGGNPSVGGSFSTAGLPEVFNNDANNVTGGSRQLANDFLYGGAVQSITLNGLIPGGEYVATIYSVGWENGTRAATFSVGADRLTVNQDQFGDNNGIRFSYHYIATASSITLTYTPLEGNSIHTYGFANYVVSLPATPTVGLQPVSQCVGAGETVNFTITAAGSAPLTYQWRKNGSALADQTNTTLTLASVTTADNGDYSCLVSNSVGTAISSNATLTVGLPVANRSFEADNFTAFPGYVGGNGPITGWASLGNHGVNTGAGPFADNGAIPDGTHAAFMQGDGALSQTVSGFTLGAQYYVIYYENARNGGVPALELQIGGATIVPAHSRAPVGGGNPYVKVTSDPFIASAADLLLSFIKSNPNGGDTTALIDNVCVLPLAAGTPPTISRQPQSVTVNVGQSASFSVGAFGSLPFTYQWRKDGVDIGGATSSSYALASTPKSAEADYTVVVANGSGSVTSAVARLTVFEPIATLFNGGLDASRNPLADGLNDPHYFIVTNADGAPISAIVENSTAFPIVAGPWLANTASSKWIGPRLDSAGSAGLVSNNGVYTYRTTFDLTDHDPSTVFIQGRWSTDNLGVGIRVNGVELGVNNTAQFVAWTTFSIGTNQVTFNPGINTIDFDVQNQDNTAGYTGLRVEFTSSNARTLPNIRPAIVSQPGDQLGLIEGQSASFSVTASGTDPLAYQWSKNGTPIGGATNMTLSFASVSTNDNGSYSVLVSNTAGSTNSNPALLSVTYRRVPGIYSTGVNGDLSLAPDGSIDQHWIIGSSADVGAPGPDAFVINAGNSPVPPWLGAGPYSKWIAPQPNQNAGNAEGNYTYQTFFDLTGVDMCTFRLVGQFSVDNSVVDIVVNGLSQGISGGSFTSWQSFTLTNGFVTGPNSVDFIINNAPTTPNPTALRVDLAGVVLIRSIVAPTMSIVRTAPDTLTVSWTPTGSCDRLQSAPDVTGPWTTIGVASPYTVYTTNAAATFFRVLP